MATLSKDEARSQRARNGQRKAMEGRKCKACGRGNALARHQDDMGTFTTCRYCGYEMAVMYGEVYESFPAADGKAESRG